VLYLRSPRSRTSAQGAVTFIIANPNFAATVVLILLRMCSEKRFYIPKELKYEDMIIARHVLINVSRLFR